MGSQIWQQAKINNAEIEFRDQGSGEPIVFVHGGMGEECTAVLNEPVWKDGYRVIHYHRRGYGNSTPSEMPVSIGQQCRDCLALLQHIGVRRAHFAGQSYGAVIVLQTLIDAPEVVRSAALLEPALPSVIADAPEFGNALGQAFSLYESGDKRAAMDVFAGALSGPDLAAETERKFRDEYFELWVRDADTLFRSDLPALREWSFTEEDARRIEQPVLNVRGSDTAQFFRQVYSRLQDWLPNAENVIVAGASHTLLQMNSRGMAERLASFCRKHAIETGEPHQSSAQVG